MRQLLATIVFAIAIFAGFTARAEAAYYQIKLDDENTNFPWVLCLKAQDVDENDRLGNNNYSSYETCIASAEYKRFVKVWEKGKKKREINPYLKQLDPDVTAMDLKPISDKYIHSYIDYFEKKTGKAVDRTKIFFGVVTKPAVGICFYGVDVVVIDKKYWETIPSVYTREALIYHELGHCLMKRAHEPLVNKMFTGNSSACPKSIMYPKTFNSQVAYQCFHTNRDYYMTELKTIPVPKFSIDIQIYDWDFKKKAWKKLPKIKDVANRYTFTVKEYKCTVHRYGMDKKPTKYGYYTEHVRLICSKDNVNFVGLTHTAWVYPGTNNFKTGFAQGTHTSGELRLFNSLLKELVHIQMKFSLK